MNDRCRDLRRRRAVKHRQGRIYKLSQTAGQFRAIACEQLEGRMLLTAAATITWTGAVDANWSTPGNWDLDRAPINGDSLAFPAAAQHLANNDDISGLSVSSVRFQGVFTSTTGGYTLGGDDLTVGAGGINDDGTVNSTNTTIANQIDLNVALAATQLWSIVDSYSEHQLTINGNVANNGFALTANGTGTIDIAGEISGSGSVYVEGVPAGVLNSVPGSFFGGLTLDLDHANTYTGGTQVGNFATVVVSADGALGPGGTNDAGTTVDGAIVFNTVAYPTPEAMTLNGGTLAGAGDASFSGPITISGASTVSGSTPLADAEISETQPSGTFTLNGPTLTNNGNANLLVRGDELLPQAGNAPNVFGGGVDVVINNVISGAGGLTVVTGAVALGAANTYQGPTDLQGPAAIVVNRDNAIPSASAVVMQSNPSPGFSFIELNGHADTIGSLAGTEAIGIGNTVNLGMGGSLTVGGDNTSTTFAGNVTGAGTITKQGSGTFDLTAANDYTGTTTVAGGTFVVDGSTAAGNAVDVGTFGVLGGSGTIGGAVSVVGGVLDPGAGPNPSTSTGALTVTGNVILEAWNVPGPPVIPATFAVQLGGTAVSPTNDQLHSAGTVSISGTNLALTTLPGAGPFNAGRQFVIVQSASAINGTFDGLPEGSTVSDGSQDFTIGYKNDQVTLTALGVVTPGTITWTGGSTTSNNWSDPANWNLHRAPINGDSLVFPDSAQRLANNDDIADLSVNSITFQGPVAAVPGGYRIGGDDLTLGAGGISYEGTPESMTLGVVNEIDLNLNLGAAQTWSISDVQNVSIGDSNNRQQLTVNGNVDNDGFALTMTGQDIIDIAGQISGSGGLFLTGNPPGSEPIVELQNADTYAGNTAISFGTLIVNGSTAAASAVILQGGATLGGTGTVGDQITFVSGGAIGLALPAGTIDPGAGSDLSQETGTLSNTGGVSFEFIAGAAGNSLNPKFAMQLGGTAANPTHDQFDSAGTVALDGAMLDLTALAGAGPFNADQQFVIVQAGAPITTTFSGLPEGSTVSDGTQSFTISYANDRVTLTALPVVTPATITWTGKSTTSSNWSDPANWDLHRAPVNGDSLVFPGSAQRLANNDDVPGLSVNSVMFQGIFDPVPGGYHIGGDDLTLGAGGITDDGTPGSTIIGVINQINLNLNLDAAQTWSISDSSNRHDLFVNGNVNNTGFELSLSVIGQDFIYLTGQISGSGGLSITGLTPTVELQGANTYTGATDVSNGTLIVDGSTAAASTVNISAGATLGGTGTIGGTITVVGGDISPGAGPDPSSRTGTLTSDGDVTIAGLIPPPGSLLASEAAVFAVQLGGTAAAPTNDQLNSPATVSLNKGTNLDLTALAGAGPFNAGQQFVIVQAGSPISGTFNGLPDGSTVSDGTQNFTISYANDRVTLTAQAVSVATSTYLNGQTGDGTAATFVHNLYRELLGREPDSAGQTYWLNVFAQARSNNGTTQAQRTLVANFLNSSEYHEHLVKGIYTDFLHRAADANGLAFWTAEMAAGVDEKNVLAFIVGSDEYFGRSQGPGVHVADLTVQAQAQAWVDALYRDVLGRTADANGLSYWTQQTLSMENAVGRTEVALQFLSTGEVEHKLLNGNYPGPTLAGLPGTPAAGAFALADITGNGWVNLYFPGGLSATVVDPLFAQLQSGASYDETIATMLDMAIYFDGRVPPT